MKVFQSFILVAIYCCAAGARKEDEYFPRKNGILVLDEHCFLAALMKYRFVLVFYCKYFLLFRIKFLFVTCGC